MVYNITNYSYNQAKKLNVQIKPSKNKKKKIDVIKNGAVIASIGDINYKDFPTYLKEKNGKQIAESRRKLYKIRHNKDRKTKWTRGWLADQLLW